MEVIEKDEWNELHSILTVTILNLPYVEIFIDCVFFMYLFIGIKGAVWKSA